MNYYKKESEFHSKLIHLIYQTEHHIDYLEYFSIK
jgi:hypothetical protein